MNAALITGWSFDHAPGPEESFTIPHIALFAHTLSHVHTHYLSRCHSCYSQAKHRSRTHTIAQVMSLCKVAQSVSQSNAPCQATPIQQHSVCEEKRKRTLPSNQQHHLLSCLSHTTLTHARTLRPAVTSCLIYLTDSIRTHTRTHAYGTYGVSRA